MSRTDTGQDVSHPPYHVVHVIGALRTGGAEKQVINYLAASDPEKFRHTVLCLTARGDMADLVTDLGISVEVHPVRLRRFLKDRAALADWMKKEGVDVVHTHMFSAAFWGRMAGLSAGVPVMVTTEHGKEPWKTWWQSRLDTWLSRRTFHHLAVSEDGRQIRIDRDRVDPDRISLVPNGVPIPENPNDEAVRARVRGEFGLTETQPVIGSVGRVIEAKAYPVLLEALEIARREIPDLHWLQVGDGPGRPALEALARDNDLTGAVTFAGRRSDIGDLLDAMDVWVMSSIREGLPVALLEAMASRKTIVATTAGGIPDAVTDGESALLVPENDAPALAAAMVRVVKDGGLADRLAKAARARAERDYSIEAVARRIEAIYLEGLKGREA